MNLRILTILGLVIIVSPVLAVDPPPKAPREFESLEYRNIGPSSGGRTSRVVGIPGDPLTYYVTTANSGVWKSTDGGIHFAPIFDRESTSSIGSIAVALSDPNVIYVGSGEANIRGNVSPGNGIYRSTDAGKTWTHVWKQVGQIGQITVHPTDAKIAYAAVLGHAFGPNSERGIYRTTDGGKTWECVLHKNQHTGASAVVLDPNNPRIIWAGLWQTRRRPWEHTSGGPGSGLQVSRDGGDTWEELHDKAKDNGLPSGIWGRVGIAIAPSDSRRIYALIEATEGGLFRSDDGGEKWDRVNPNHILRQRAWYFSTMTVDPLNRDVVYFPQVPLLKSLDGGKTVRRVLGVGHLDHHDIWIDPKNPRRMIIANDGGAEVTTNAGETWYAPPLPIAQFYHIAVDHQTPYHVMGNMQDMGTAWGPSRSLAKAGIRMGDWHQVGGGETGFSIPDPRDENIIYSGQYGGILTRHDRRTGQSNLITAWPYNPSGFAAADLKYRYQWTAPLVMSKRQPGLIYHAANVLFASTDQGQSWNVVSPDLTRNDRSKQRWSGGPITGDNTGVEVYDTIFSVAEGIPGKDGKHALWCGTDDGLVQVSRDMGKSWTNVTSSIEDMPDWGTVVCIEPSPTDADTAFVVVDNHRMDDNHAYLWVTHDLGKTWTRLAADLPEGEYLHVLRIDPIKKGLLFLGTEKGVRISRNEGKTWEPLKLNMPTVPVHDLVFAERDLVVGTMGRGIWILDDLTPIRQWDKAMARQAVHLFAPSPAARWRLSDEVAHHTERYAMPNPAEGAAIFYSLSHKTDKRFTLEILDSNNRLIDRLDSEEGDEPDETLPDGPPDVPLKVALPNKPGVNRVVWNLKHRGAEAIAGAKVDSGNPTDGALVAPGVYTVKLVVGGDTRTSTLTVLPDPRFRESLPTPRVLPKDIITVVDPTKPAVLSAEQQSEQLALKIRDGVTEISTIVKQIHSLKQQIHLHEDTFTGDDAPEIVAWRKQAGEFRKHLNDLEEALHNPRAKVVYDILAQKGGAKLYSQLVYLYDFALSADGPPPQGLSQMVTDLLAELRQHSHRFAELRDGDLAKLNTLAKEKGLPVLRLPKVK